MATSLIGVAKFDEEKQWLVVDESVHWRLSNEERTALAVLYRPDALNITYHVIEGEVTLPPETVREMAIELTRRMSVIRNDGCNINDPVTKVLLVTPSVVTVLCYFTFWQQGIRYNTCTLKGAIMQQTREINMKTKTEYLIDEIKFQMNDKNITIDDIVARSSIKKGRVERLFSGKVKKFKVDDLFALAMGISHASPSALVHGAELRMMYNIPADEPADTLFQQKPQQG